MQLKRLIKSTRNIEPFKRYQLDDCFVVERNGIQEFRSEYKERCILYIRMKLAQMKKEDGEKMKRLIKTRKNIEPFKVYQVDNGYIAELNDVEVFRTKHQHLATSFCEIELAQQRREKNEAIFRDIQEKKAQGIL